MRSLWHFARWGGIAVSFIGACGILSGLREMFKSGPDGDTLLWLFMLGVGGVLAVGGIALERKMAKHLQQDRFNRAFRSHSISHPSDRTGKTKCSVKGGKNGKI